MGWNDESWKDSYDAWKTREPDYDDEPQDECEHEETEMDVCTGRVDCQLCNAHWYASTDEVMRELDRQASHDEWCRQQERPWSRFKEWCRSHMPRLPTWRRSPAQEIDDGIPF